MTPSQVKNSCRAIGFKAGWSSHSQAELEGTVQPRQSSFIHSFI